MKMTIRHIIDRLMRPFTEGFPLFVILLSLLTSVSLYSSIVKGVVVYGLYVFAWGFLVTYVSTLVVWLIPNTTIRRILGTVLLVIGAMYCLTEYFSIIVAPSVYYGDIVEMVHNTNIHEAVDFLKVFLSLGNSLLFVFCALLLGGVYYLLQKYDFYARSRRWLCCCGAMLLLCVLMCLRNPTAHEYSIIGKGSVWVEVFTRFNPDLHDYYHHPELDVAQDAPTKVVIVIGESFTKQHSSLYGYDKVTNPRLAALPDSNLYVFKEAISPEFATLYSFKVFMSDYKGQEADSRQWYECQTIPEIFSVAGYRNTWLSNQERVAFANNVLTAFAELCDEMVFVNELPGYDGYDGMLITQVDSINRAHPKDEKDVIWIHLMGSHYHYADRYPNGSEFDKFSEADYLDYDADKRVTLKEYDNSLLYNDYVVREIIDRFGGDDAMVVYFSDHGLDLYYTDNELFCFYGAGDIEESARAAEQIPMLIYVSDKFREARPATVDKIRAYSLEPFNTRDLITLLMDLCGIT